MNKMQLFFIFWLAGLAACTPHSRECDARKKNVLPSIPTIPTLLYLII